MKINSCDESWSLLPNDDTWWKSANEANRCQHIRRQYETGHQVVAKVLATDNSSFTQVQNEVCIHYCIKMNVNVRVLLLSGLACLLAGPCWWAGGLCREVFPKRALEAQEKRALKRNSVSEGCQEGSQAPDALAFISADGMGFLDDSFLNSKRVTDT